MISAVPSAFWAGMVALPVLVAAMAHAVAAVAWLIRISARVSLPDWKLWPRNVDRYGGLNRAPIAATVATAKRVRYLWIPGWHFMLCRTTLPDDDTGRWHEHMRMRDAIAAELRRTVNETRNE